MSDAETRKMAEGEIDQEGKDHADGGIEGGRISRGGTRREESRRKQRSEMQGMAAVIPQQGDHLTCTVIP